LADHLRIPQEYHVKWVNSWLSSDDVKDITLVDYFKSMDNKMKEKRYEYIWILLDDIDISNEIHLDWIKQLQTCADEIQSFNFIISVQITKNIQNVFTEYVHYKPIPFHS